MVRNGKLWQHTTVCDYEICHCQASSLKTSVKINLRLRCVFEKLPKTRICLFWSSNCCTSQRERLAHARVSRLWVVTLVAHFAQGAQ